MQVLFASRCGRKRLIYTGSTMAWILDYDQTKKHPEDQGKI
jgi:hypothetical protein